MVAIQIHLDCSLHGLEQALFVDARQDEAGLVQGFGALGGGADADRREGLADAGEEATFLRQGAGIGDDREGVHLQAVIIVEAQGLLADDPLVKLEAGGLQPLFGAGVAGVQNGHIVGFRHFIDGREEAGEILLGVDVLLPVGGEQDVLSLFKAQARMDIAGFDFCQIVMEHLCHGRTGHIGPLLGQTAVRQVAPRVLGVGQIHVGDDVHDPAVCLLGQALILAAVARFHVEDGDMQPLCADDGQAGVGIAQHQHGVRLDFHHELIGLCDDVAHRLAQIGTHGVQVDLRVSQLEIPEEHTVQVVVVILSRMGQNGVEIFPALGDHRRQPDDLRPGADNDQKLQFSVVLKLNIELIHMISSFRRVIIPVRARKAQAADKG